MGLLTAAALALALGACYSPSIRDCTRSCAADSDCVTSQVCTADHLCATPGLATGCGELLHDAAVVDAHADARPRDAAPDAWPTVPLMIQIDGSGMVTLTGGGTCDNADCTLHALKGVPATVTAIGHGTSHPFDKWTSTTCLNQPAVCTFTPTMPTTVAAKFK